MSSDEQPSNRLDAILVVSSITILISALWIWISALPIEIEVVTIATTIALVIALVLTVNASILVVLKLQHRVSSLEKVIAARDVAKESEPSVIVVTLSNMERRILNQLEAGDGQMGQDELRRATGISKSTLSVNLQALEGKGLIERATSGRTKTIRLLREVNR